jgi:transcriptional regulator with XRE-family HTH domain
MSARPAKRQLRSRGNITLPEAVAARVRDVRLAMGWSQTKMAKAAGLSIEAVSRIERGERDPRLLTLEQIGAAVGCPLPKLLDFTKRPLQSAPRARDLRARAILRLLDQLDPWLGEVVINLLRDFVRVRRKRARKGRLG